MPEIFIGNVKLETLKQHPIPLGRKQCRSEKENERRRLYCGKVMTDCVFLQLIVETNSPPARILSSRERKMHSCTHSFAVWRCGHNIFEGI